MRVMRLVALVLLALSLLDACGDGDEGGAVAGGADGAGDSDDPDATPPGEDAEGEGDAWVSSADHVITVENGGSQIAVEVGDTIDVVLQDCPSCGYHWEPVGEAVGGVIALLDQERVNPTADADAGEVGGYFDQVWHYEAVGSGAAEVALGYFPPGSAEPEETFSVTVVVAPADDATNDVVVFGEAENGTTVTLGVGTNFDVALPQCRGCGYQWRVVTGPDATIVEVTGENPASDQPVPEDGEPMVGGETEYVFHFSVAGVGTTTIELGYFPPGEPSPEDLYTLTIEAS